MKFEISDGKKFGEVLGGGLFDLPGKPRKFRGKFRRKFRKLRFKLRDFSSSETSFSRRAALRNSLLFYHADMSKMTHFGPKTVHRLRAKTPICQVAPISRIYTTPTSESPSSTTRTQGELKVHHLLCLLCRYCKPPILCGKPQLFLQDLQEESTVLTFPNCKWGVRKGRRNGGVQRGMHV